VFLSRYNTTWLKPGVYTGGFGSIKARNFSNHTLRPWFTIMKNLCTLVFSLALCVFGVLEARATDLTSAGIKVTTSQQVHPVLIRNEHNPLLRVIVDVNGPKAGLRITAFTFDLSGTDNVEDIESLSLYCSGDRREFETTIRIGDSVSAARTVTVPNSYELRAGRHVFWLSCRLRASASLVRKVDAACTGVTLSNGDTLAVTDQTPGVRKRIGVALRRHYDDGVHTHRIAALATTSEDTLLCAYDLRRRKSRDLQEDIDIGLSRSTDGGQTWEAPRVIMDMKEWGGFPQELNGVSDPGLLVDQNTGEIFCFAVWMVGKPGKHQWYEDGSEPGYEIGKAAQFLMVRSKDDGKTWSEPENLTRKLKKPDWWVYAPAPQQGLTLSDGTLVMPTDGRDENDRFFSNIMYSRDNGRTWTVSEPAFRDGTECQAVQLSDGSLMLNMRTSTDTGYRGVAVTPDLGKTWKLHPTHLNTLIEPRCNGSLYRFDYTENGASKFVLLFANPQSRRSRVNHTIQVSLDEGMTWPEKYRKLLDYGRGRGYPSISRVDDKHIGLVYEGSQADLSFEKISLDELLGRE